VSRPEPFVGEVLAVRAWRLLRKNPFDFDGPHLISYAIDEAWKPGEIVTARCVPWTVAAPEGHESPNAECQCGVWGLPSIGDIATQLSSTIGYRAVIGTVKMWGRIVVGTRGFRAQHARAVGLFEYPPWPLERLPELAPGARAFVDGAPFAVGPLDVAKAAARYGLELLDRVPQLTQPEEFLEGGE
jgi:hypothetical protein